MQKKSLNARLGIRIFRFAVFAVFLVGGAASGLAQTTNIITLLTNDAPNTSSFTGATNWNNGLAPATGSPDFNAYFTTNFTLRTPADGNNYAFAGDSLEVDGSGGALGLKGSGTITVANLVLNGGKVSNSGTGGSPDTGTLAGNITLAANSTLDGGATAGVTALNVLAPMSGSGGITISDNGTVIFSTNNTYTGNTTVSTNSTLKMGIANAFATGPGKGFLTLSPGVNYSGILDLNGFDTTVNSLSAGGSLTVPSLVTNSAVGVTNTLTVDVEVSKTYKGYINEGVSGKLALTVIGSNPTVLSWVVSSNLNYSGDTTINGARLAMGQSGNILPWGTGKGNLIVTNGGIFDLSGRSPQINGLSGNGIVDNLTTGTGHSTFNCGSNDVSSTFGGVIQNSQYISSLPADYYIQITKFGAGTLTLAGTNTYNGNVTVHDGVLRIAYQNGDDLTGGGLGLSSQTTPPTKIVSIDSSTGDAGVHFLATNGTPIVVTPLISWQTAGNSGAIVNEAGNNIIGGMISLRTGGGTTIRVDADTLTLTNTIDIVTNVTSRTLTLSGVTNGTVSGVIRDGYSANIPNTNLLSLTKSGAGTWTLTANNTYSDVTTINGGTLLLAASGSISNTPTITLQSNATFDVSSWKLWKLGAGQTLNGSGNVAGSVTASGTIAPGTSTSIGVLTFSNQLTLANVTLLKLNRTNSPANADLITVASLVRGGTLTVTNIGDPLQAGDSFTLFSAGITNGSFSATNLPSLSSGLIWDSSLLGGLGIIKVASEVVPQPHILNINLSGTNLVISGTNGLVGEQYNVLTSTNVTLPFSQWTVLPTNAFSAGDFTITNTVNANAPQNFYLLRVP